MARRQKLGWIVAVGTAMGLSAPPVRAQGLAPPAFSPAPPPVAPAIPDAGAPARADAGVAPDALKPAAPAVVPGPVVAPAPPAKPAIAVPPAKAAVVAKPASTLQAPSRVVSPFDAPTPVAPAAKPVTPVRSAQVPPKAPVKAPAKNAVGKPKPRAKAKARPRVGKVPMPKPPVPGADPFARPFFVKGDLQNFAVRPTTRRNFIGIGAGINALPANTNTVLNAYYLSIEPQIDIVNPRFNWKLGLGAPLLFELIDLRGAFELCMAQGRASRMAGGDQNAVALATGTCVLDRKDRLTENFGQLRRADWDEASDFARIIRYFVVGGPEQPFYLNVGRLNDLTLGHGTVIRHHNPNIEYNTARVGASFDFNKSAVGLAGMTNDLVRPDMLGMMLFTRPFRPFTDDIVLRSLSFGITFVHGVNQPLALQYEPGLFTPSFDQPLPKVDATLHPVGARFAPINVLGGDVEVKVLRTTSADLKLYADFQKMPGYGGGISLGTLIRHTADEPATRAFRMRVELNAFDADYLPGYFDAFHDIFQAQYLPSGYTGSNGLRYYPTKLGYLQAMKGGPRRMGASVDISHAFLDLLTVGATARGWVPIGGASDPKWLGPQFPDYGPSCFDSGSGDLDCGARKIRLDDQGFASLRLYAELPFRKFLQAFASYEAFTTTGEHFSLFKADGDNEILFSGARLMLLPILFVQAEARRYFFLQRIRNVNFDTLTLEQDQSYHANWTFAFAAYIGYEFN